MRGSVRKALVGCMIAAAFGASPLALAGGGMVAISGAVLEATCAIDQGLPAAVPANGRFDCGAAGKDGHGARAYVSDVALPTGTPLATDRLIGYYAGYLKARGERNALRLVTRTYE